MSTLKLLNQKGVDALFAGNTPSAEAVGREPEAQPYNFLRPPRIPRKTRTALETVYEEFVQRLEKALTLSLRTQVTLAVTEMEPVFFSDLALSLGSPAATFLFRADENGEGTGLFDWSLEGSLAVVDRMMGGPGHGSALHRALTSIEREVVQRITQQALLLLADAWKDHLAVGREITGFEVDPSHSGIARPEDRYLAVYLQVTWEGFEGTVTVALPHPVVLAALEPERGQARRAPGAATDTAPARAALDNQRLKLSHVTLSARLPETTLTLRQVTSLRTGQVIDLGYGQDVPVHVHVNGKLLFLGSAGEVRGRLGVRIREKASTQVPERLTHTSKGRVL